MSSTSPTPPLTTWELVKMTGPIIFFGILLPTVDNLTDLRMIIKLYSGIPECKLVWYDVTDGPWEDAYTCQQDPDTYCQENPGSSDCEDFYSWEYPVSIPGCTWDYKACKPDPATFCENKPHSLNCGHYKHVKFATMFLGIFYP